MNEYITEEIEIFTNYDVNCFDEYLLINKRHEISKKI